MESRIRQSTGKYFQMIKSTMKNSRNTKSKDWMYQVQTLEMTPAKLLEAISRILIDAKESSVVDESRDIARAIGFKVP